MKKILSLWVMLALSVVYFSCEQENGPAANAGSPTHASALRLAQADVDSATALYAVMVQSAAYADYKLAIKNFASKLSTTVRCDTKDKWMAWISTHLGSTSFVSVAQFEAMYDDCIAKLEVVVSANHTLFNMMKGADEDQLAIINAPGIPNPRDDANPIGTSSCIDDCIETAYIWLDLLQDAYNVEMAKAEKEKDELFYLMARLDNDVAYAEVYEGIVNTLNDCAAACL